MIITKTALPRRTFLRGVGATIALPFLDAMVPALAPRAYAAAGPAMRVGFVYVGNGMQMDRLRPPGEGPFECSTPTLSPLAPFRDQVTVVSNLAHDKNTGSASGVHTRAHSVWLTGMPIEASTNSFLAGTSIDQYAAQELGRETPLLSLELALEPNFVAGKCEGGFSCTYLNTFSWRTPTTPLPMESDPRSVFVRLFGEERSAEARAAQLRIDRSILDDVREDMTRLNRKLGTRDRAFVAEYFSAVRDVERRIQKIEERGDTTPLMEKPLDMPEGYDEHVKLMFDLVTLAFQADITRVVTVQLARDLSGRSYPQIGVPEGHHEVTHHQDLLEKMDKCAKINAYHVQLFAGLMEKLRNAQDGDGSLLDNSMFLYGAAFGNSNHHVSKNLPAVLVGGGAGRLRGGRHLTAPVDTPMMNLGLSLLDKVGVELPSIGDSTGRLADL